MIQVQNRKAGLSLGVGVCTPCALSLYAFFVFKFWNGFCHVFILLKFCIDAMVESVQRVMLSTTLQCIRRFCSTQVCVVVFVFAVNNDQLRIVSKRIIRIVAEKLTSGHAVRTKQAIYFHATLAIVDEL